MIKVHQNLAACPVRGLYSIFSIVRNKYVPKLITDKALRLQKRTNTSLTRTGCGNNLNLIFYGMARQHESYGSHCVRAGATDTGHYE